MNKYFKIFLIFSLVFLFSHQASAAGLVPCGGTGQSPCTPCHLWDLANNVIKFIFVGLAIPILTVVMIWGGVLMMTGGADSILEGKASAGNITKGKKMLRSGVIGIFIAAGAWLIVTTIVHTFAGTSVSDKYTVGWADIECDLDSQPPSQPPVPPPGPGTQPPPATALQCSASSVSPLVNAIISCVMSQAAGQGISVAQPTNRQMNEGCHSCASPNTPASGCSNSGNGISCHYGGTRCAGTGNAVDFALSSGASPLNWGKLRDLAINCGGSGGAYCEAGGVRPLAGCSASGIDHVHVNASASCGCQ